MISKTETSRLPSSVLAKRTSLPGKPSPIILEGRYVRLEPLIIERDARQLFERSNGSAIQDSHFIVKECNRDTAWFRILDREWPEVKDKLESLMPKNDKCRF